MKTLFNCGFFFHTKHILPGYYNSPAPCPAPVALTQYNSFVHWKSCPLLRTTFWKVIYQILQFTKKQKFSEYIYFYITIQTLQQNVCYNASFIALINFTFPKKKMFHSAPASIDLRCVNRFRIAWNINNNQYIMTFISFTKHISLFAWSSWPVPNRHTSRKCPFLWMKYIVCIRLCD